MEPRPDTLSRRAVLLGAAGLAGSGLLASCSSGGHAVGALGTEIALDPKAKTPIVLPLFDVGDPYVVTGSEQRLVFGLQAPGGSTATRLPSPATVTIRADKGGHVVSGPTAVVPHDDGVPIAYYPVRATFPATGYYAVDVEVGGRTGTAAVEVFSPAAARQVQRGDAMRPVETPTPADHRGVEPICTRSPACSFHGITLTAALRTGKPTAFLISTPEFCQIGVCGPSLDLLIEAAPRYPSVQFLHAEVYEDAAKLGSINGAKLAPAVTAYDLPYEPVLFLVDGQGRLVDRLDNVFDRKDMAAALAKIS